MTRKESMGVGGMKHRSTDLSSIELYPDVGVLEKQIQMCDTMIVFYWNYEVCREKAHGKQMKMSDMNLGVMRQKPTLLEKIFQQSLATWALTLSPSLYTSDQAMYITPNLQSNSSSTC